MSTAGVRHFDAMSAAYGAHADARPEFVERFTLLTALIEADLRDRPSGTRALDLGCGRGHLTRALAVRGAQVVAVDGSQAMLDGTAARLADDGTDGVEFRRHLLPLPEAFVAEFAGECGLIVLSSVIEYVERDLELLAQCHRMLAPDGTLLVSFPNARSLYWKAHRQLRENRFLRTRDASQQVHQYTADEVRRQARRSGFDVEHLQYFSLPLQRFVPRRVSARPAALATLMVARMRPSADAA